MDAVRLRRRTVSVIDGYLSGAITGKEASDWALEAIISADVEGFPDDIGRAVHLLFDLHDGDSCWVPGTDEFEQCKEELMVGSR